MTTKQLRQRLAKIKRQRKPRHLPPVRLIQDGEAMRSSCGRWVRADDEDWEAFKCRIIQDMKTDHGLSADDELDAPTLMVILREIVDP